MLGRVQGTLIQESDVSDVSESITGANIKPGPSHSSGLVWVDGSARYWQEESSLGAPLHCPAPLKIGGPSDDHWTRQWRRGQWDTGSCQVVDPSLLETLGCTCGPAHATVSVDGWDTCSAYELEHKPRSW